MNALPQVSGLKSQVSQFCVRYQPRHTTGKLGPMYDWASLAAIWVFLQRDVTGWTVWPVWTKRD